MGTVKLKKYVDIYFLLMPRIHLLDFSGPAQAIYEAKSQGAKINVHYVSADMQVLSAQGISFSTLKPLPDLLPLNTIVIACASQFSDKLYQDKSSLRTIEWLRKTPDNTTKIVGICTGAFALGAAGWLDKKVCTTHYRFINDLRRLVPKANVVSDRIFIQDGQIYTTAGVTAGIDLILSIIEEIDSLKTSVQVAKDLMVCRRRLSSDPQISKYLLFQEHNSAFVRSIQEYIEVNIENRITLVDISNRFRVSTRHIQREFKDVTGITISQYINNIRIKKVKNYLDLGSTIEFAAYKAGFTQTSALRLAWKKKYGSLPSEYVMKK